MKRREYIFTRIQKFDAELKGLSLILTKYLITLVTAREENSWHIYFPLMSSIKQKA